MSNGEAPDGPNRGGELSRFRLPRGAWECRECHYKPNARDMKYCVHCGRDYWGNPGRIPTDISRDGT